MGRNSEKPDEKKSETKPNDKTETVVCKRQIHIL